MGHKFKVGDRVQCIRGYDDIPCGPYTGWTGTVRGFEGPYDPIITWDGHGVRSDGEDRIAERRLSLIEAAPFALEHRIAALEARLAALEGTKEEVMEEAAQYTFGQPVEVRGNADHDYTTVLVNALRLSDAEKARLVKDLSERGVQLPAKEDQGKVEPYMWEWEILVEDGPMRGWQHQITRHNPLDNPYRIEDRTKVRNIKPLYLAPAKGSGWISVEDRLPEENVRVLALDPAYEDDLPHALAYIHGGQWRFEGFGSASGPTHWMPLPAPPDK